MNLVKWFRKNNTKVMAVVVVVLMIGFVGGTALTSFLRGSGGMNKAVAYYGPKKHKITPNTRALARQELEILQALGAAPILQSQNLRGMVLSELLFSQDRGSGELMNEARRAIQRGRYRVSEKQLAAIYEDRTVPTDIYWILLRDEALSMGFHVRAEEVGPLLGRVLPQLSGATYAQAMQALVNRYGIPENAILATFGKLLAVLQYAEAACSTGNVTTSQIRHLASYENQMLTVESVELKAAYFQDKEATPSDDEIAAQFDKYKDFFPGEASEANPYGFGYKLPDRIQIEYIAIDLNDVSAGVTRPTPEETEAYYQSNREREFTQDVQADPNDPNSPRIPQVQPYAEVAGTIADRLTRQKVIRRAEQVLLEARSKANAGMQARTAGDEKPTVAQLQAEAGDYEQIALELGQRYSVSLYSGRSGFLSATDVVSDTYLRRLALTGYGANTIPLSQQLFSTPELGEAAVSLMFVPEAEMYRTYGPAQDPMIDSIPDLSDQIMAIVRIVAVEPAAAPENVDVKFSTKTLTMGDLTADDDESVHSVRENVISDLRLLAAWETTKAKAQEFVELATEEDWDKAVSKFNELYGEQAKDDPNDPNVFELRYLPGLRKIADEQMETIATQMSNVPGIAQNLREGAIRQRFVDRLFSLIPSQSDSAPQVPMVLEFKPDRSFYCLKDVSVRRLDEQRFQTIKPNLLVMHSNAESQSLAVVHFNPTNILKRMNLTFAQEADADTDEQAETPQEDAT